MSSLGDIQQIYVMLQEIDRLLTQINMKTLATERNISTLQGTFMQVERVALRYLALTRRMGLPDDVDSAIDSLTRLITIIRMAQIATNLLLATNPLTAAVGIPALLLTVISFGDLMAGY